MKVNNQIKNFNKNEIQFSMPLDIKIISDSATINEQIIVPVVSDMNFLQSEIEQSLKLYFNDDVNTYSFRIFLQGREITKNETLDKIGIKPHSKLLAITVMGKPLVINRFPTVYEGWGYSNSVDAVSFSVNKDVRIIGFGIYRPEQTRKTSELQVNTKMVEGNDVKGNVLIQKSVIVTQDEFDQNNKIFSCYFDRSVIAKANETYSLVMDTQSGNSYYGSGGKQTVPTGHSDIIFTFTQCNGSFNGTGFSSGQIPEIYYYV